MMIRKEVMYPSVMYPDAILVSLSLSERFLVIRTTDYAHGKSERFYASVDAFRCLLDKNTPVHDFDLRNSLQAHWASEKEIAFCFTWLHLIGPRNDVHGYQQRFLLPQDKLEAALNGDRVKLVLLEPEGNKRCPIVFTVSANEIVRRIVRNPLKKRALSKALRDHFRWQSGERVTLYRDCREDFLFSTCTIDGGLCLHQREVRGKDGMKHVAYEYTVHT